MPQPGEASQAHPLRQKTPFWNLLVETLEGRRRNCPRTVLSQFFRTIAQVDLTETQSNEYWDRALSARRNELA